MMIWSINGKKELILWKLSSIQMKILNEIACNLNSIQFNSNSIEEKWDTKLLQKILKICYDYGVGKKKTSFHSLYLGSVQTYSNLELSSKRTTYGIIKFWEPSSITKWMFRYIKKVDQNIMLELKQKNECPTTLKSRPKQNAWAQMKEWMFGYIKK